MSKEQETMDNFGGFNSAADIDFFGEDTVADEPIVDTQAEEVDATEDAEQDETVVDAPESTEEGAGTEEDISFFEEETEDDAADEEEQKPGKGKPSDEAPTGSNVSLLKQLKDKGLADFTLEEGEELTEERAAELLEDSYEAGIENRLSDMLAGLPPVTRDLIKFAINGGDESEFLSKLSTQPTRGITKEMDLADEKNQELVMRKHLASEDYDDDYINGHLEYLKDSGKLEAMSKKIHGKLIEKDEQARAAEVKRLEDQKRQMKENKRKFKSDLSEFLNTSKEIKGLKISDKDRDLASYIADDSIKTDNGAVTPLQRDLFNVLQDKEKTVLLAKLLKSDFDFSDIANASKTQTTKKIQEDVRRSKATGTSGSSRSQSRKSLADFFN